MTIWDVLENMRQVREMARAAALATARDGKRTFAAAREKKRGPQRRKNRRPPTNPTL